MGKRTLPDEPNSPVTDSLLPITLLPSSPVSHFPILPLDEFLEPPARRRV
jgi:hypothetical protein